MASGVFWKGEFTIAAINQELEELGWGVDTLDYETYELIMLLPRQSDGP